MWFFKLTTEPAPLTMTGRNKGATYEFREEKLKWMTEKDRTEEE